MKLTNVQQEDNKPIVAKLTNNCEPIAFLEFNEQFNKDGDFFYKVNIETVVENETLDPFTYRDDYENLMNSFYYHLELVDSFIKTIPNNEQLLSEDGTIYNTNLNDNLYTLYDDRGFYIKRFESWIKTDEYLFESLVNLENSKQLTKNTKNL